MIELKISLDSIDYSGIAELVMPLVRDKLANNGNILVRRIFENTNPDSMSHVLNSALNLLSQDQKDEITISLFERYKDRIVNTIEQTAQSKGIELSIKELSLGKK